MKLAGTLVNVAALTWASKAPPMDLYDWQLWACLVLLAAGNGLIGGAR